MTSQLVLVGAGGHAKVCYEIAIAMNKWSEIIILDDNSTNNFFEVRGPIATFEEYPGAEFFVAIGSNRVRHDIIEKILKKSLKLATLVHPSSVISVSAQIGTGTVIMPGVIINANTAVGKGVIVNTASSVDHDNIISDFVHISPGCHLAGNVFVGENSWIGIGTIIKNNTSLASDITIGAGSLVLQDLKAKGVYFGNPAKLRKEYNSLEK